MKTKNLLTIGIVAFFISCNSNDDVKPIEKDYNLVISTGTQCGWCTGTDSINVDCDAMHYETNNPCNNPSVKIDMSTSASDWNELESTFDWNEFNSINLNTCNYCADGCDTWISITCNNEFHRIQYGYEDSLVVKNIKPLIDKLAELKISITSKQYNNSNN
jgi:hypothetical protein